MYAFASTLRPAQVACNIKRKKAVASTWQIHSGVDPIVDSHFVLKKTTPGWPILYWYESSLAFLILCFTVVFSFSSGSWVMNRGTPSNPSNHPRHVTRSTSHPPFRQAPLSPGAGDSQCEGRGIQDPCLLGHRGASSWTSRTSQRQAHCRFNQWKFLLQRSCGLCGCIRNGQN